MTPKTAQKLLYFAIGAFVLESLMKKSSLPSGASNGSSSGSLLSSLTQGITNMVNSVVVSKSDFVQKMTPIARQIQGTYGIDPLITISQAALESGWGRSQLAAQYNNLFGFTAGSWLEKKLPVVDLPTYEYIQRPIEQVNYFETPGDILSKEAVGANETKVKVHRYFRQYGTWYDSASDWANLITGSHRYNQAVQAAISGDLASYAELVSAAGYATDPNYPQLLTDTGASVQEAMA